MHEPAKHYERKIGFPPPRADPYNNRGPPPPRPAGPRSKPGIGESTGSCMEIIIQPTVADAQQEAANILRRQIRDKPASVLGLATGSTPIGVYGLLMAMHRRGELDFSRVSTFNL